MPITNFPFGVSSFGVPVLPGLPTTTGKVLFVCNASGANGSDGNPGTPTQPLATVDQAIGLCTSAKGDVIVVMPGHAETVTATSIALDVAGVQVIGLGTGVNRPVFTFGAAAATITVSAAGCAWRNCHFVANFLNVASAFTLSTAKDFQATDSSFIDTSAVLNFLCLVTTDATSNRADGLTFDRNKVSSLPTTDGACVSILAVLDRLSICDNSITKAATADAGHVVTMSSFAVTNIEIKRNTLSMNALASQSTGTLGTGSSTACSGMVSDNRIYQIDTSTALLFTAGTKLGFIENYMSGAADKSGTIFPAADDPA
jgi:hypothetical protein